MGKRSGEQTLQTGFSDNATRASRRADEQTGVFRRCHKGVQTGRRICKQCHEGVQTADGLANLVAEGNSSLIIC